MKSKLFLTLVLSATVIALNAQMRVPTTVTGAPQNVPTTVTQTQTIATPSTASAPTTAKVGLGSLISQFTGQISPSALTDAFNKGKGAFQTQAQGTGDVKGTAGLLQRLEGGLKSTAFTSGWAAIKDKWLGGVKSATTTQQLGGYLKTLTENVNPKFLSSNWETIKPMFNTALSKVTK